MTAPLEFVIGQPQACELLGRALANDRIAHAYLVVGPAQTGKTTLVHAFAQALLGREPETSADWRSWRPDGKELKVAQIRELIEACTTPPMGTTYQVFALFGADSLNQVSANALLKTLEEPPPRTVIILVADRLESVLPTIRSRTQLVLTSLVPAATIETTLLSRSLDPERARELAQAAGGRIGWALAEAETATVSPPWPAGDPCSPLDALAMARTLGELTGAELRATIGARLRSRWASGTAPSWDELDALESAITQLDTHVNPRLVIETLLHRQGRR